MDKFTSIPVRTELLVERKKSPTPPGWFIAYGEMYRCDRMHELSFWKHKIKRAYVWHHIVMAFKTRRWDYWNEGL